MASECDVKDLADMIHWRITHEANLVSSSMIQSISTTLVDATRHLYEVLNARQSLFKLPPELLTRIVHDVLRWPLDEISYPHGKPAWRSAARATKALLPVTHTCRRLRQVILADTTLWRHVTNGNRHFIDLLLSRGGTTSPVTLMLSPRGNPPQMPQMDFPHLSQLAPRLQELQLLSYVPDDSQAPALKLFLKLPFPHLQYFSLIGAERSTIWKDCDGLLPLSGQNAPNIRYLHLQLVPILPPESGFPCLSHLSLSSITVQSLSMITNILRSCPALTSLVLRRVTSVIRFFTTQTLSHYMNMNTVDPLYLPDLSRVILADMDWDATQYFASIFSHHRLCIQIPFSFLRQVYPREVFESLYLQYADEYFGNRDAHASCLSVAVHSFEDDSHGTVTGLFIMLANSTSLLRITLCPKLLGNYCCRLITGGGWRENVLTPLRTLPGLREVWLTDMDMDTDVQTGPLWTFPETGARQEPAATFSSLESVVIVHDCSMPLRRLRRCRTIQPSVAALPMGRAGDPSSAAPNLARLRLAIGYDADDLPRLCEAWNSGSAEPQLEPLGKVDLSAKLLHELASGEYAYVKQARLVVQLMPHLVLDADELERLREHFAAVVLEEIERLPTVPVPERVRDDALAPEGFIPGSVLY
ncbi:hypothetical protein LXA43DRAFT_1116003 [Ganoderma leucocontextum]|nr:hypothetical protein LXA43DRAFT_1116003 [Ganoderma leucocontextum]